VVEREREISAFTAREYWTIEVALRTANGVEFTADRGMAAEAIRRHEPGISSDYAAPPAQFGQRFAEFDDPEKLLLFLLLPEAEMVEVLRAPLIVDADGLKWRIVATGHANFLPRRRNTKALDTGEGSGVMDALTIRCHVGETGLFRPFAANAVVLELPSTTDGFLGHDAAGFARMMPRNEG